MSSGRPVLQELPKNRPRQTSIFIPDKNSKKSNANKQMRRVPKTAPSETPVVPCAPMQPSHPLPARLPSPEASDREDTHINKKRKLEDGEEYNDAKRGKQLAIDMSVVLERMQAEIDELRDSNADLQQQKLDLTAEIETCRVNLLKEKDGKERLAQQHHNAVVQQAKLERQYSESSLHCAKLNTTLERCRADYAVTESRLLEDQRTLRETLKKSQDQMKELEALRTAKRNLTLANEELRGRHSKLVDKNADLKTSLEQRAEDNAIQRKQLEQERQASSMRERKLSERVDELIRTNNSLKADLATAYDTSSRETALAVAKEAYEVRLRRAEQAEQAAVHAEEAAVQAEEAASVRVRQLRAELDKIMASMQSQSRAHETKLAEARSESQIALSVLQAECKQKDISLQTRDSDLQAKVDQLQQESSTREQLKLINELLRESHVRASRSLQAVLDGAHQERCVAGADLLAERALSQKAAQEVMKLKMSLHLSDTRLAQLDAHKNELYVQCKKEVQQCKNEVQNIGEQACRALDEKTAEIARLQHAYRQLGLQLTASNNTVSTYSNEVCQRDAQIEHGNRMLHERELALLHQRKCQIATKWHCAAIKAQRAVAWAEREAQREEIKRLMARLHGARLARVQAESAMADAESAKLIEVNKATTHCSTIQAELNALVEQKKIADDELRTLKATLQSHVETLKAHETCPTEKKWLDDKYQETFDANQSLNKMIAGLRAELAAVPVVGTSDTVATLREDAASEDCPRSPKAHTVDRGTDPAQEPLTINTSVQDVCERQLATPASSMSPAPPSCIATRLDSRTPSRLRTDTPADTTTHQLLTPGDVSPTRRSSWTASITPKASEEVRRTAPTQPRNFAMEKELMRRRHDESIARNQDLFPHKQTIAPPRPPMRRRSVHKRPFYDSYRP